MQKIFLKIFLPNRCWTFIINSYILLFFFCRKVNASIARREMLAVSQKDESSCLTGNPIDDCWKCDPNWANNRQRLADCAIGFGQNAKGGKGGEFYIVTDSSDDDPVNPKPGTLRYAVIQNEPLWIVFPSNMMIKLSQELIFNSYKTIDGRGADVHIVGGGCITLQYISNVIIHNIHVHHCHPSGMKLFNTIRLFSLWSNFISMSKVDVREKLFDSG